MKNFLHTVKARDGDKVPGADRAVTIAGHMYTVSTDRERRLEIRIKGLAEGVAQLGMPINRSVGGPVPTRPPDC